MGGTKTAVPATTTADTLNQQIKGICN